MINIEKKIIYNNIIIMGEQNIPEKKEKKLIETSI